MLAIPVKVTGDAYTAAEFTSWNQDVQNAILSAGIALSGADLFQLAKMSAIYAGSGTFYVDSGAANAYVLSPVGAQQTPISYGNGREIRFVPANRNTGASTVNVDGLGARDVETRLGDVVQGGQLRAGEVVTLHFNTASDAFRFIERDTIISGQMGRRIITATTTAVTSQPLTVRDKDNGLDIVLDAPITKQLNATFALGDAAGGRATGVPLSIATPYHVFLIYNNTTGVTDMGFDTSVVATNLLASGPGFTHFRRIWSVHTELLATTIIPFTQFGNRCAFENSIILAAAVTGLQPGPTFSVNVTAIVPDFPSEIVATLGYSAVATAIGGGGDLRTRINGVGVGANGQIIIGLNNSPNDTRVALGVEVPVGLLASVPTIGLEWQNTSGNLNVDYQLTQHGWIDNLEID